MYGRGSVDVIGRDPAPTLDSCWCLDGDGVDDGDAELVLTSLRRGDGDDRDDVRAGFWWKAAAIECCLACIDGDTNLARDLGESVKDVASSVELELC